MMGRILVAAMVVILIACGSTPQGKGDADIAQSMAAQQRYVEALAAIDQAITKEPRNKSYKAFRSQYVTSFGSQVKRRVAAALAAAPSKAALDSAEEVIAAATDAGVPAADLATIAGRVAHARELMISGLAGDYQAAVAAMNNSQWVDAYNTLSKVEATYPGYEDTTRRLDTLRREATREFLALAGRALKKDDLVSARAAVNELLEIDPQNNTARSWLSRINDRDNKAYFVGKVAESRNAGDDIAVEKYCNLVLTYDVNDSVCQQLLASLGAALASQLVDETTLAIAEGKLFDAADKYMALAEYDTGAIASKRSALRGKLSEKLFRAAELAGEDNQPGMAWALLQKLGEIDPSYDQLVQVQRGIEDRIRQRTRKSIAVFDFSSPSENADSGVIVANSLQAQLFNNAGRDIKILERNNLKSILEEMKLGQAGIVSEEDAQEMGRVHGIDFAIMGNILLYQVETTESESSRTVRYQIGEQIEDNIDYLNWKAVNPKPSKDQLRDAPPAKIKVPEYAITEYDVAETKKVGFLSLSYRIVDVSTGENTRVDTIEKKKEVRDTSNEGLPDAGVAYDPMEVITNTEMMQLLTDEVVDVMSVDVLRPLQSLEKTHFERGEALEKRGESLKAIEAYVDGIFNERIKSVSASPLTAESVTRINELVHAQVFDR